VSFVHDDELWAGIIYEFASAFRAQPAARSHLVKSLTPLYLGRVASFVNETRDMSAAEVERRIESLCVAFENLKPLLVSHWNGSGATAQKSAESRQPAPGTALEV